MKKINKCVGERDKIFLARLLLLATYYNLHYHGTVMESNGNGFNIAYHDTGQFSMLFTWIIHSEAPKPMVVPCIVCLLVAGVLLQETLLCIFCAPLALSTSQAAV